MRFSGVLAVAATIGAMGSVPASGTQAVRSTFGTLKDGTPVPAVKLTNSHGVSANIIAWGASLQSLMLPGRDGKAADIVLGYADMTGYLTQPEFFGATVGRFANRIARGKFSLDGKAYQTPVNDGVNSLHGGTTGFDKRVWTIVDNKSGPTASVTLRLVSQDGDQGYPGTITVDATYSLDESNALTIDYRATTDRPTIVNLSNHAYWNLAGEGSVGGAMGHVVTIPAERFTPVDATLIPTGELRPVAGTVFDFRTPHAIGDRVRDGRDPQMVYGRGYDHNWVIGTAPTSDIHLMAKVSEPVSGRGFTLWSNQPGLQFYSGNFLNGTVLGKSKRIYRGGDAIVMEPQLFPDTANQPKFGSGRLDPGQTYHNVIVYRLTTGR